jgi:hypothetical protein
MLLSAIELRFLQGLLVDSSDRSHSACAELFYRDRNIGTRIGRKFVYAKEDVARAESLLVALNLPLTANDQPIDRADAAMRPGISEKSGTSSPHANAVAFRLFVGRMSVAQPGYQVATVEEVGHLTPDLVVVIENFETLRQLERYEWVMERLTSVGTTLVLFRGDSVYRLNDARRSMDALDCPVWGFHDFDPAGLYMSMSTRNFSEHLVPPQVALRAAVEAKKRSDLYFSQFDQYARTLEACSHPQIAALWVLMKSLQKGLPQEWMRDL